MRKTYMSIAVSRALSAEYPVGDPYGGPAFGRREMPVVVLAAAVYAGATIATVGIMAMTAFEVMAAVGAITAGIGVITGNDKLVKIGGIIGLVGGVGALASSAGMLGDFGTSTMGDLTGTQAASVDAGLVSKLTPEQLSVGMEDTLPVGQGPAGSAAPPAVTPATTANPAATGLVNSAAQATPLQTAAPVTGEVPVTNAATGASNAATLGDAAKISGDIEKVASKGIFETLSDYAKPLSTFAKDNPMVAYGAMQTVGSFVGGAFDKSKTAQADYYSANANLTNAEIENINRPLPTAVVDPNRRDVFRVGQPPPSYTPPGSNRQAQVINTVTGKPI